MTIKIKIYHNNYEVVDTLAEKWEITVCFLIFLENERISKKHQISYDRVMNNQTTYPIIIIIN